MRIPSFILKKLYVPGSLREEDGAVCFRLRNTLATATLTEMRALRIGGHDVAAERVRLRVGGADVAVAGVSPASPFVFGRNQEAEVRVAGSGVPGRARVRLVAVSAEFGELVIEFEDDVRR